MQFVAGALIINQKNPVSNTAILVHYIFNSKITYRYHNINH